MPTPYDAARAERVADLTRQGLKAHVIADRLGITVRTVRRDRARTGTSREVPRRLSEEQVSRALSMLQDGCAYIEVSRTLGIPTKTLRQRFPGYGMESGWDWAHQLRGIGKYRQEAS
ncbi:helix-turn-helix DNA binding domain protein [Gordonia phage RedWattleHog]|uniref:Helix-turn-helix DNA binding domain protein n=1 Tax=Gordonia phage Stormageddon TaxID=2656541 RepID=A0A649VR12_9CAUD|nr:DNA binding protein [Gordonia phage Stormageddon]QGJ94950.1 helix-turn-helix DNA binding domain protein [Gordonia phage Stormageddon]QLF83594.1 helix-turn-helix DNA binding domain protein [Gordonia phage RedWattleHog]